MAEYLTEYADRLASSDPKDEKRQHLADRVLKLFRQVDEPERDSISLNRRTRLALYDIAVARYDNNPSLNA